LRDTWGKTAGNAARALTPRVGAAGDNLRKDFAFWNIGFRTLRAASITQLQWFWVKKLFPERGNHPSLLIVTGSDALIFDFFWCDCRSMRQGTMNLRLLLTAALMWLVAKRGRLNPRYTLAQHCKFSHNL
jgi:hypothetical protein